MTLHRAQKDSPSTYLTVGIDEDDTTLTVGNSDIFQHRPDAGDVTRLTLGFDTATTETVTVVSYGASNTIVVERGTPAYSWSFGTKIARVLTAQDINEIQDVLGNIVPRTRSFLVPAVAGGNIPTFEQVGYESTAYYFGGLNLSPDMPTAYGYFSVPKDFVNNMTVTPIFTGMPGGTYNYWVRRSILSSGQGSAHDLADSPSTNIVFNSNPTIALNQGTPIVLSSVALGDYVLLMLTLNGAPTGYIYLTGFLVSYTAKF